MQYRCLRDYSQALKIARPVLEIQKYTIMQDQYKQDLAWLDENFGACRTRWSVEDYGVALSVFTFTTQEDLVLFKLTRGDHG